MTLSKTNVLFDKILLVTAATDEIREVPEYAAYYDTGKNLLIMKDAYVSVRDGLIIYIGLDRVSAEAAFAGDNFEIYNGKNKLVWPTITNTHGHIPMTLMRNQTDDHNLHDWLFNVIFPMEAHLTPEHVYHGSMLGMAEMIRHGTGAAADMYYFSDSVAQAARQSGFRLNVCCDGKLEGSDGKSHVSDNELASFKERWEGGSEGLIRTSLLVHSIYLYEPYLYEELAAAARKHDMYVQVHISETSKEVEDCLAKYGKRPPQQLDKFGLLDGHVIAAHCVHLDDDDRALLAARKVTVAHNPASNFKLGSGFADIAAMVQAGIHVSLGTDGAASNNNLDLYQEMRLAGYLAKGLTGDASVLPAGQLIQMATLNGMRGLGFDRVGCLLPGWKADLQIVDIDHPAMQPLGDPEAALVYSCSSGNVESMMVDGVWLMYKNDLKTIDEEKTIAEAVSYSNKLS